MSFQYFDDRQTREGIFLARSGGSLTVGMSRLTARPHSALGSAKTNAALAHAVHAEGEALAKQGAPRRALLKFTKASRINRAEPSHALAAATVHLQLDEPDAAARLLAGVDAKWLGRGDAMQLEAMLAAVQSTYGPHQKTVHSAFGSREPPPRSNPSRDALGTAQVYAKYARPQREVLAAAARAGRPAGAAPPALTNGAWGTRSAERAARAEPSTRAAALKAVAARAKAAVADAQARSPSVAAATLKEAAAQHRQEALCALAQRTAAARNAALTLDERETRAWRDESRRPTLDGGNRGCGAMRWCRDRSTGTMYRQLVGKGPGAINAACEAARREQHRAEFAHARAAYKTGG